MHTPAYTLNTLFAQLGLDDSDQAIEKFISEHSPIPESTPLAKASCWNASQKKLLEEALADDSDWAEVVDHLDVSLRK